MTRSMFGHLARHGHVIMDVAYRLCPDVDFFEMLGDVKRAVAWMKSHAEEYRVDPKRVVLAGGSAGGHLALMSAYAPDDPALTPADLLNTDLSVRAVVSLYGPTDLRSTFQFGWSLDTGLPIDREATVSGEGEVSHLERGDMAKSRANQKAAELATGSSDLSMLSVRRIFTNLLGGVPAAVPEIYDLASPVSHVGSSCPPTLVMHGSHDTLVPVDNARQLYRKLRDAGVPAVYVELPETEHGFDLVRAEYSPPARIALYHMERFLALIAAGADRYPQEEVRELLVTR
jgi:acetyl esterase/lipase